MPSHRSKSNRPKGADFHVGSRRVNTRKDTGIEDEDYYDGYEDYTYYDEKSDELSDAPLEKGKGKVYLAPETKLEKTTEEKAKKAESLTGGRGDVDSGAKKSTKEVDKSQGMKVGDSTGDDDVFAPTQGGKTAQGDGSSKEEVNPWGWDGDGGKK